MLKFDYDAYTDGLVTRAYMDGRYIATCVRNGSHCTVRWGHLDHPTPGYIEDFASESAARAAIEAFVESLDFAPWDEFGRPIHRDTVRHESTDSEGSSP